MKDQIISFYLSTVSIAFVISFASTLLLWPDTSHALKYSLPAAGENMVGQVKMAEVQPGDKFITLRRRHNMGHEEILLANPTLGRFSLKRGQGVTIPSQFILPDAPKRGIVVNLSERRLYYYPKGSNQVETYPIAIGRRNWDTPIVSTKITQKKANPTWYIPDSIRNYAAKKGKHMPRFIPPGPKNPLGKFALRFGEPTPTILLHGTNHPRAIGRRASSGCIRLFPEDIQHLYNTVPVGTPVKVVDQPYKATSYRNHVYLEAHKPLSEHWSPNKIRSELTRVLKKASNGKVQNPKHTTAYYITKMRNGIPQVVRRAMLPKTAIKTASR